MFLHFCTCNSIIIFTYLHPFPQNFVIVEPRFLREVSPSRFLGQTQGLAGNSKSIYEEFVDPKSEVSAPMYFFEGSTLRYSAFAWILGLTNLAQ